MRVFLLVVAALEIAIVSPVPALDRWQAAYRERVRMNIHEYLPESPQSEETRALLREICALPDSAFRE